MRYLGIDYGEKRIGLAISDQLGIIAGKLKTLENLSWSNAVSELQRIINEHLVDGIVIGLPKNLKGEETPQTLKVKEFIAFIKGKIIIPVYEWNEMFTSKESNNVLIGGDVSRKDRKKFVDQLSAVLILQGYLDSLKSTFRQNDDEN
ncbi:MAG: Holliday junction resolvase RuvX [bacterium]|nr:Holliday junction resolvase RuvX [bacterium]